MRSDSTEMIDRSTFVQVHYSGYNAVASQTAALVFLPPPPFERRKHERHSDAIFALLYGKFARILCGSTASLYEQILNVRKAEMNGTFVSIFSCRSSVCPFREAFGELLLRFVFGFYFSYYSEGGITLFCVVNSGTNATKS